MLAQRRLLFFDDYPHASENALFLLRLRQTLRHLGPHVLVTTTTAAVERELRATSLHLAVLDVMAAAPADFGATSSRAGIEVLRRCRAGLYLPENATIPIFMRTARGEAFIRELCAKEGCTGFFSAGAEDSALLKAIEACLGSGG